MSRIIEHDHLTSEDMGLDNGSGARIYADVLDDGTARVTFVDYTRAHTSRHPELADGDRSGWLTAEARAILLRLARERFGVASIDDDTGDEPNVTFEWEFPDAASNATAAQLGTAAWPNVAAVLNETDPGTFGARYIYADVARELALVDLDFARDTLGPDATDAEVDELARQRAARDAEELTR